MDRMRRTVPHEGCLVQYACSDKPALVKGALLEPERLSHFLRKRMRGYTLKEKAKLTAGAVAALVIVAWLVVAALALLSAG